MTTTLTENAIRKRVRRQGMYLVKSRKASDTWVYRIVDKYGAVDGECCDLDHLRFWFAPPAGAAPAGGAAS